MEDHTKSENFSDEEKAQQGLGPSSLILFDILQIKNYDRVISESKRFLEADPEDRNAHYCLGIALVCQKEYKKAKSHIDFLLSHNPEEENTRLAVIFYFLNKDNFSKVRKHAAEGLRTSPENSTFLYYAAVADFALLRFKHAKNYIDQALDLAPDDPEILDLSVQIDAALKTTARDAWNRVESLKDALQFDPHNPGLHNSLGTVICDELGDPQTAEFHFREALRSAPGDRLHQTCLFDCVAQRNLLYRLVSIPSRSFKWVRRVYRAICIQPWRLIFLILAAKIVGAYFCWLFVATVILWPAAKFYEWLLVSEIKAGSKASTKMLRIWYYIQKWPRYVRVSLFLLLISSVYLLLFGLINIPIAKGFAFVGFFAAVHLAAIIIAKGFKTLRARLAKGRPQSSLSNNSIRQ